MQATLQKEDVLTLDEQVTSESLIDANWRDKPARSWEEVYDELCKDLGQHYGLHDIRFNRR